MSEPQDPTEPNHGGSNVIDLLLYREARKVKQPVLETEVDVDREEQHIMRWRGSRIMLIIISLDALWFTNITGSILSLGTKTENLNCISWPIALVVTGLNIVTIIYGLPGLIDFVKFYHNYSALVLKEKAGSDTDLSRVEQSLVRMRELFLLLFLSPLLMLTASLVSALALIFLR